MWVNYVTHPVLPSILCGELFLHIACCLYYVSKEFLWHIPCWLFLIFLFYLGSLSYTSRAGFLFLSQEFLLHIPSWFCFYLGSFSYTSRAGFNFTRGLLHISCCLHFYRGVSLIHRILTLFLCGEFFLHIPCCLHFYAGSFSYTSYAGFIMYARRLSYTSCWLRVFFIFFIFLLFYLPREFLLHFPCWFLF